MFQEILIRYGELSTKGKNKKHFVNKLVENIEKLVGCKATVNYDRIFVPYSEHNLDGLNRVFGIQSYSPVIKIPSRHEDIIENSSKLLADSAEHLTFRVSVKRAWKGFPGTSTTLNGIFADELVSRSKNKASVKNPDLVLEIEIRDGYTLISKNRVKGLGGYPVGIGGKIIHLISGGIDSPVAAYNLMKRGLHVDYFNFITPPHTDEKTISKVDRIVEHLTRYQGESTLYQNNYTDILNLLGLTSNQAYKIILMRRSFYRIVSRFAIERKYLGISNGENLGQVASQTLESMRVIQTQSSLPIYRPVLTADKLETIMHAKAIGTHDISIERANESCELFAPTNPIIKPALWVAEKLESELDELAYLEKQSLENNTVVKTFEFKTK